MPDDVSKDSDLKIVTSEAFSPAYPNRLVFTKPIEIDGKTLSELNLDLESITKKEYSAVKHLFRQKFGRADNNQSIGLDERFQNILIARLNGITPEGFVEGVSIEDEEAAHMIVSGFFQMAGMNRMKTS